MTLLGIYFGSITFVWVTFFLFFARMYVIVTEHYYKVRSQPLIVGVTSLIRLGILHSIPLLNLVCAFIYLLAPDEYLYDSLDKNSCFEYHD